MRSDDAIESVKCHRDDKHSAAKFQHEDLVGLFKRKQEKRAESTKTNIQYVK